MFEGLISSILNRILGKFVENLDSNQLNFSLWSGTVSLFNLQVKQSLFDSMPVPFQIHYGNIGRIFIEVPYTNIAGAPLKIEISDVFVFIKPKDFGLWKDAVEIEAFISQNLADLEKFESIITE